MGFIDCFLHQNVVGAADAEIDDMDVLLNQPVDGLKDTLRAGPGLALAVQVKHIGHIKLGAGQQSAPFWLADDHEGDSRDVIEGADPLTFPVEGFEAELGALKGGMAHIHPAIDDADLDAFATGRRRLAPIGGAGAGVADVHPAAALLLMLFKTMMHIDQNIRVFLAVQMPGVKRMRAIVDLQVIKMGAEPVQMSDVDDGKAQRREVPEMIGRRIQHQ